MPGLASEDDNRIDLTGADVDTPRGDTAKGEVKRLRGVMMSQAKTIVQMSARAKFIELDVDKSGFLENAELEKVVIRVLDAFGEKLGTDPKAVREKMMLRLDANKDGKLDPAEFEGLFELMVQRNNLLERAKAKFLAFDSDSSGFLELKEIDAVIEWSLQAFPDGEDYSAYKAKLLQEIDKNGDGKLDLAEFIVLFEDMLARLELVRRAKTKFDELDADKSGMLELTEIDAVAEWVLFAYVEKSNEDRSAFKATLMRRIDVNQDGKLSLQEFAVVFDEILLRMDLLKRAKNAFAKLDADNSGFLEKAELESVVKKWAEACGKEIGVDVSKQLEDMMAQLDVNGDGKLDSSEFVPLFELALAKSGMWGTEAAINAVAAENAATAG